MITLQDAYQSAKFYGNLQLLLALDETWTNYLAQANEIDPADVNLLNSLVKEMVELIDKNQEDLSSILLSLRNAHVDLTAGIRIACKKQSLKNNQIDNILAQFKTFEGDVSTVEKIQSNLAMQMSLEKKQILSKIDIINKGHYTLGDMSKNGKCALGWACVVAGAALEAWPVAGVGLHLIAENCLED